MLTRTDNTTLVRIENPARGLREQCLIEMEMPFECLCPVNKLRDSGTVRITYQPDQYVIEYGSFRDFIQSFSEREILHEAFTLEVWQATTECTGTTVSVVTEWAPVEGVKTRVSM